jgi:DNA mismatch repair ATPase MutL
LSLSLALASALAFGSLAAQQGTPAPSPKTAKSEKTSKKPKESKATKETKAPTEPKQTNPTQGTKASPESKQTNQVQQTKTPTEPKQTKASEESKATKAKPEPAGDESEQEIDIPVPDGVPVKGIKVPSYSPEGKLLMMLDAEQARKLDAERIEFENLKIDAYSDDDKKIYVELPRSIFNLTTRILTSESRVLIRREDFELVGDAGEFYTKNRFAKILGNVKMTILSTENFNTP